MNHHDNQICLDGGCGTSHGYATLEEVFAVAKEGGIIIENGEDISGSGSEARGPLGDLGKVQRLGQEPACTEQARRQVGIQHHSNPGLLPGQAARVFLGRALAAVQIKGRLLWSPIHSSLNRHLQQSRPTIRARSTPRLSDAGIREGERLSRVGRFHPRCAVPRASKRRLLGSTLSVARLRSCPLFQASRPRRRRRHATLWAQRRSTRSAPTWWRRVS